MFGFVLLVVNIFMIIIGFVFLFWWYWLFGMIFLVMVILLWICGYLFEKCYGVFICCS